MRIGVISDLHIDINEPLLPAGRSFLDIFVQQVEKEKVDLLLIAGDISNDFRMSLTFLQELEEKSRATILFVPGNHDYWSKENKLADTWKIYQAFKEWPGCISEKSYHLHDEWVIIGNSGWYDHSFGSKAFSEEAFQQMKYSDRTWQDSIYTNWGKDNRRMHQFFYQSLENELKKQAGKNIIMMTHMVTHPSFIVPMPHEQWSYFNAFLGSQEYQELYHTYRVKYGIMGHVHYRKTALANQTKMICACLGNYPEWKTKDIVQEISDTFVYIDI